MDPSARRHVIVVAVAAPVITAVVMGVLIFQKMAPPGEGTPAPATGLVDTREEALFKLASAGSLAPDDMLKAADEAERAAGSPLVEACLVRAHAARKKHDAAAERAAIDKALAIDGKRPEAQLARALAAVDAWAREAAPVARVHSPDTTLASPLLIPPATAAEPGLDAFEGRAGDVMKLLAILRAGAKPEEVAPLWTPLSSGGVEDRLAFAGGVHSLRLGYAADALPWLRTALSAAPDDPARLRCAALAALLAGDGVEAFDLLQRWTQLGGAAKSAEAFGWGAVAARKLGDLAEARSRLDEASKLDPAWRGARGWLAYQSGDKTQALADAVARRESDPWARYLRALLHWDAGEVDEALAECATLLEAWPDHYEALVLRARGLTVRNLNDKAEEVWKHALKLAAGRVEAKLGLAEFYAATGKKEDALATFLEIPGHAVAHWRAAQLIFDLGRTAEALRWTELGIQRYPRDARLHTVLGRILHARLDHFGERTALEKAASLDPEDSEAKKLLLDCVVEMKRD